MSEPDIGTPRLVHLLDPREGGEDAIVACRIACERSPFEHHVWLLGTSADERWCADLGLVTTDRFSVGAGPAYRAAQTLGRLHVDRARAWGLPARAVVAWSARTAQLAEAEMWDVPARVCVLTTGPGPSNEPRTGVVRALAQSGIWSLCALGQGLTGLWHEAGASGVRALPVPTWEGPGRETDRRVIREALGVRPEEHLLMLLAGPARSGDAHRMVSMAGIIHYAGVPLACAVHRDSAQIRRAVRYVELHHHGWDVIDFDGPMTRATAAADVLVWDLDEPRARGVPDSPSGGIVLAASAAAAGTVVVAPNHSLARELLGECPRLISRSTSYPDLAHVILPLLDDPAEHARCAAVLRGVWRGSRSAEFGRELSSVISGRETPDRATVSA